MTPRRLPRTQLIERKKRLARLTSHKEAERLKNRGKQFPEVRKARSRCLSGLHAKKKDRERSRLWEPYLQLWMPVTRKSLCQGVSGAGHIQSEGEFENLGTKVLGREACQECERVRDCPCDHLERRGRCNFVRTINADSEEFGNGCHLKDTKTEAIRFSRS